MNENDLLSYEYLQIHILEVQSGCCSWCCNSKA